MQACEKIVSSGQDLVYIIRREFFPGKTTFFTSEQAGFQVGCIVYPQGKEIARHFHRQIDKEIKVTNEVLVIYKGSCLMDIYDKKQELVTTCKLKAGDVVIIFDGGHGFRMLDDTIFLEIKQGPYTGLVEKELF